MFRYAPDPILVGAIAVYVDQGNWVLREPGHLGERHRHLDESAFVSIGRVLI
jgi:hypothetical protein